MLYTGTGSGGLFARTGGAKLEDISIGGFMNIRSYTSQMHVGGAIAYLKEGEQISETYYLSMYTY